ncbi:MAG: tRNA-dihydrouridine synthase family protein [Lachnospiraceae bacterium]|nr:tRNA-dihydrouridine synthase family protein [Lachnospiraceae bacterium]
MKFYFAPLEGITGYIYRNTHHEVFGGMDQYYTPFVSPSSNHNFKSREKKDVLPGSNKGTPVIPQILTNHGDEFIYTAERLLEYGYAEINLNLGCPSGTVVSKGRGAGFLAKPEELDRFLDEIFSGIDAPISVKTRIGKDEASEFTELLRIYNRYPICELTIHPRLQTDMYKNTPDWDTFAYALENSKNPVCYNGDINTLEDYQRFAECFPEVDRLMIGRGLIANPGLVREIQTGQKITWPEIMDFADRLYREYRNIMPDNPVLFKMKEIWFYMSRQHSQPDKIWKKIKKTKRLSEYENVIRLFRSIN